MRKITAIILAAVLMLTFAGCKGKDGGSGGAVNVANGGDYSSLKNVSRQCVDAINNGFSTLRDNYGSDFYDTKASTYAPYMNKGQDLLTAVEYVFMDNEDDAKRNLKEILYMSDVSYSVSGNTATATGKGIDGENAKVVAKYDGSQSGQVEYYADDVLTRSVSFVTTDSYNVMFYYDNEITTVSAVYTDGDIYYAFDADGASEKVSLMDKKDAPKDKSFVTNNRLYIAMQGGSFVNTSGSKY